MDHNDLIDILKIIPSQKMLMILKLVYFLEK